ncbi:MAG: 16S rRNA (uracil(1498)-N(3))-methyltransferase [bacterium]|jgi:16S rRNA (uracil1498-N3)-methyltransferase|nr:16S rRNA (uracil(1498)-N(3))-methyltransferase [Betaproteobacteria bacterium]
MLTPRFHCPQAVPGLARGSRVELPPDAAHHALRVLRLGEGQAVAVFCGHGGEYEAVLEAARGKSAQVLLGTFHAGDRVPRVDVHVQQAVVATEKMDWVVEKSVELGARWFTPVLAERSVVRLTGERAGRRAAHWQALAVSASEQCGLNRLLEVRPVQSLEAACGEAQAAGCLRFMLHPEGERSLTLELSAAVEAAKGDAAAGGAAAGALSSVLSLALLVGPEGGLSPRESALARAAGYRPVTLGPRILRTETAALAALAALRATIDDFSPSFPHT